jgi:hypothetical protein
MTSIKNCAAAPINNKLKETVPTQDPADKQPASPQDTTTSPIRSTGKTLSGKGKTAKTKNYDGIASGLLAIGIYALMHDSGIMTILLLAFVWWYSLEESHQRIFLFFLVILNFAEYFYLLPPVLARYQQEDWWDVPTIKTALLTMAIFWSIAWFSAYTGSYLESKEQRLRDEKEKLRAEQQALFQQPAAKRSP